MGSKRRLNDPASLKSHAWPIRKPPTLKLSKGAGLERSGQHKVKMPLQGVAFSKDGATARTKRLRLH